VQNDRVTLLDESLCCGSAQAVCATGDEDLATPRSHAIHMGDSSRLTDAGEAYAAATAGEPDAKFGPASHPTMTSRASSTRSRISYSPSRPIGAICVASMRPP